MKKIISLLSVSIAVLVILGCKGGMGLSKAEVEKMIKESQQNGGGSGGGTGNSSISDILETAVSEVSGKVWTVDRNKTDAGMIGGKAEAGFDHEITFDKESFTFSITMKDGGIMSQDETVNQDYMDLVKTGVAELKDGKLIFKNRMYIKGVYLPKLSKWLSLNGTDMGTPTDDPFNKYFKDGYHQGYPNLLLDVDLEVQGTGSGRFRNADNLATVDSLRLVIKDGKLSLKAVKEGMEVAPALTKSFLDKLMFNYYGNSGAEFTCKEWPEFKEDIGKYSTDPTMVRNALNTLKGLMRDTDKRKMPTAPVKWGYALNGAFNEVVDVNLVFDPTKIVGVVKKMVPNPMFNPDLPEGPGNLKEIEGIDTFAPLFTAQPDPENIKKAHPNWVVNDTLKALALTHAAHMGGQNTFMAKDFDKVKTATVEWKVLYGTNLGGGQEDSTTATITVKREVTDESSFENAPDIAGTKYRSDKKENVADFDHDNPTHWKELPHAGKVKKYKVSYTLSVKFDDIHNSYFSKDNDFKTKALSSDVFEVRYVKKTETNEADYDWVYTLDPYSVMEKNVKKDMWLKFSEVELYGTIATKKPDGTITVGAAEKLTGYLKRPITGDTVLNNQTHFFVSSVLSDGKYISKITKIKLIPSMENVRFDVTSSDGSIAPGSFFEARLNVDNSPTINITDPTLGGTEEFPVLANKLEVTPADGFEHFKDSRLIIRLSGLGKHVANREGHDHSPSNKTENWQGYSFVIHFGK